MSGSYPNPFFTDPNIARGFGILARTFLPDADGEASRQARLGAARRANVEADRDQARLDAGRAASARLRTGQVDQGTLAQVFADAIAGGDPQFMQALPAFIRGYGASAGATPDRLAELFVGAGGAYENTQPGFDRVDTTRRRGQDVSAGATIRSAEIGAAAQRYSTDERERGNDRRFTVTARPGDIVTAPENSPVAPAGQQGPVTLRGDPRPTTLQQALADELGPYIRGEGTPEEQQRRGNVVAPGVSAATVRTQGRTEQIALEGANRIELQRLRDDAAAGRQTVQGEQRLQQLEAQNAAALERVRTQQAGATDRAGIRGAQRVEQIVLQGSQAADLQRLRGEQAAGRLTQTGQQRLDQIEAENAAAAQRVGMQNDGAMARTEANNAAAMERTRVNNEGAMDRTRVQGAQRVEQIGLQGAQATDLQRMRDDAAAGRLTVQGQQRLDQLEAQNAAAMERTRVNNEGAMARTQAQIDGRPPPNVPASILERLSESIAAPMTFRDGTQRTLDAESQRWMRERTTELWQNGPEGVRGNPEVALREAWLEYENAGPTLTGTRLTGRGASLPPSLRRDAPATPGAQGGYRNPRTGETIPEGATIRQNGRNYIIRNGQPVPAS